jgi:hypothetical protein
VIHKCVGIRSMSGLSRFGFIHLSEHNRQILADGGGRDSLSDSSGLSH